MQERNFGLDVARALAIASVLVCHLPLVAPGLVGQATGGFLGIVGVELFFVLSGLLIGEILLREQETGLALWRFWRQRWLRTLPAYAVATLAAFAFQGGASWRYLFFLQNASPPALALFPVSWSLSIEEWFYLAFPLALLLLGRRGVPARSFIVAVALFLLLPAVARLLLSLDAALPWDDVFRKQVPLRLDAPALGLLLAWLRVRRPGVWRRLDGRAASLAASLAGFALVAWLTASLRLDQPVGVAVDVAFSPLISLSSALLIAWLHGFAAWPAPVLPRFVVLWGSRLSYGLYLVHWYLYFGFALYGPHWGRAASAAAVLAASLAAALAMYVLVERPFLRLRARLA